MDPTAHNPADYHDAPDWPQGDVLKDDRHSRVWRTTPPEVATQCDTPPQSLPGAGHTPGAGRIPGAAVPGVVVKQRTDHPLKQALLWAVKQHPFQREAKSAAHLRSADLPALRIHALFTRPAGPLGLGRVAYLVSEAHPRSAYHHLLDDHPIDHSRRRRELTRRLGALTAQLLQHGVDHRDYKLSNILLAQDDPPTPVLIDLAPLRPLKPQPPQRVALRMLHNLLRNAREAAEQNKHPALAKVRAVDRLRLFRAFQEQLMRNATDPTDTGGLDLERLLRSPDFAD
ncbi:MAG: lipopolysaccharide kinase InaA family protein [Planctomycetota bacterium]